MADQGPRPGALGVGDVAYFLAELAVYAAVALAAWRVQWWLAPLAVAAMALWWGLVHSPKARYRLARPADLALRAGWFLIGVAGVAWLLLRR